MSDDEPEFEDVGAGIFMVFLLSVCLPLTHHGVVAALQFANQPVTMFTEVAGWAILVGSMFMLIALLESLDKTEEQQAIEYADPSADE